DLRMVREQVTGIMHASPVVPLDDRVPVGGGKERDIRVLGVDPEYRLVRNLVIISGRYFDEEDAQARSKVGVITNKLAEELYGSTDAAVGQVLKLSSLPFTVIGTFKEGVETFGQSEVQNNTMIIPYTVSRYFTNTPTVRLRSEEHTSELQSRGHLVCRLLLEKKKHHDVDHAEPDPHSVSLGRLH